MADDLMFEITSRPTGITGAGRKWKAHITAVMETRETGSAVKFTNTSEAKRALNGTAARLRYAGLSKEFIARMKGCTVWVEAR